MRHFSIPSSARTALAASLMLATMLLAASCNFPTQTQGAQPGPATMAVMTMQARFTQAQGTAELPGLLETSQAEGVTSPLLTPAPEQLEALCEDRATFVEDVSVRDNTEFAPGQTFTKVWALRNDGTCPWTPSYAVVFVGGHRMQAPEVVSFPSTLSPGEAAEVRIDMTAPEIEGTYQGFWKLRNADGIYFGIGASADQSFWVKIVVRDPGQDLAEAGGGEGQPATEAAPSIWVQGSVELAPLNTLDLDSGALNVTSGADIALGFLEDERHLLIQLTGAFIGIAEASPQPPTPETCAASALGMETIALETLGAEGGVCYRTDQGRLGRLSTTPLDGGYLINYVTWSP